MTVCVSHVYRPYPSWMITSALCDPHHGWTPEFSFYAASSAQQQSRWKRMGKNSEHRLDGLLCFLGGQPDNSAVLSPFRRLYYAQHYLKPHPSRVCVSPPGCGISSGPDGPTRGTFYAPLLSGEWVCIKKILNKKSCWPTRKCFLTVCVELTCLLCVLSSHWGTKIEKMQPCDTQKIYSLLKWHSLNALKDISAVLHLHTDFFTCTLVLFSQILHLLPKGNHPKLSASTLAVVVYVAARQCVLWSTLGPWFLLCLAFWESTEPNAGITMLSATWWGPRLRLHVSRINRKMWKGCSHVADVVLNSLQRAASYWTQTSI